MKTITTTLLLLLAAAPPLHARTLADTIPLTPFEITLLDDSIVNSSDLAGKVLLLILARTTLPANPRVACARSIGLLNLVEKEILDRFQGEEDLVVLPVFTRYNNKQEVTRLARQYRYRLPLAIDKNKQLAPLLDRDASPRIFVVDREGIATSLPGTRAYTAEERDAYKKRTGKNLPPERLSLEPAVAGIREALEHVPAGKIDFRPLMLAEALDRARKEAKQVLVTCYLPWYASSQYLLKKVFTRAQVGEYCNERFVCLLLDMQEKEGARLQKRFNLPFSEPTTLILHPDGSIIYRIDGALPPAEWLSRITEGSSTPDALDPARTQRGSSHPHD